MPLLQNIPDHLLTRSFLAGGTEPVGLMAAITSLIERLAGGKNSIGILSKGCFVRTLRRRYQGLDVSLEVRTLWNRVAIFFQPSARENQIAGLHQNRGVGLNGSPLAFVLGSLFRHPKDRI